MSSPSPPPALPLLTIHPPFFSSPLSTVPNKRAGAETYGERAQIYSGEGACHFKTQHAPYWLGVLYKTKENRLHGIIAHAL